MENKDVVLVSACLLGVNCRYNGGNKLNPDVVTFLKGKKYISLCPEKLSGFVPPHPPAEILGGDGRKVLKGSAKVVNVSGEDVTSEYLKGARLTMEIVRKKGVKLAIFKDRSPACGVDHIHNGEFKGVITEGEGVTTALLRENGINVFSEKSSLV